MLTTAQLSKLRLEILDLVPEKDRYVARRKMRQLINAHRERAKAIAKGQETT